MYITSTCYWNQPRDFIIFGGTIDIYYNILQQIVQTEYTFQSSGLFQHSWKYTKNLPMTGFEPRTCGIWSDCSVNWATTTTGLCHCFVPPTECSASSTLQTCWWPTTAPTTLSARWKTRGRNWGRSTRSCTVTSDTNCIRSEVSFKFGCFVETI